MVFIVFFNGLLKRGRKEVYVYKDKKGDYRCLELSRPPTLLLLTSTTWKDKTKKTNKCVSALSHPRRGRRPTCRDRPVVFAWLRPECSSADQIHTEEEDEEEKVQDLDWDWLLWKKNKQTNASVLLCDSLRRHFVKDEKQTRKHNNKTVPKQNGASTLQNKQTKKSMSRVLELYTCCTCVSVVSFFRGCIMASAERRKTKRSTNMPKGGPPLAASNTSAVLRFLPKGSHAVAGRLSGPAEHVKGCCCFIVVTPAQRCHVSRFTITTITSVTFNG